MSIIMFGYVGPDTLIPLGTALAVAAGIALTFGRWTITLLRKLVALFQNR